MAYFFFGTSRHLSLGTYGVVSLMVKHSISKFEGKLYPHGLSDDLPKTKTINDRSYRFSKDLTLLSNYVRLNTTTSHMITIPGHHEDENLNNFLSTDPEQAKVMIATGLAFLVGVIQVIFL